MTETIVLPRVTDILKAHGLIDMRWFTDYARDKGSAVHACAALLAENDLDWKSVDPAIEGRVRGVQRFLIETSFVPTRIEQPVNNLILRYRGTPDLVGLYRGRLGVFDLKTGSPLPWHKLQLALYFLALHAEAIPVIERWGIYLGDGTYRIEPCEDLKDLEYARALVLAYHAKIIYTNSSNLEDKTHDAA